MGKKLWEQKESVPFNYQEFTQYFKERDPVSYDQLQKNVAKQQQKHSEVVRYKDSTGKGDQIFQNILKKNN